MVISVGDIDLGGQVVLAPMSGVTDLAFRRSVAACGAAMVVSEMVASEELVRGRRDVLLRAEGRGLSPFTSAIGRSRGSMDGPGRGTGNRSRCRHY